MTERLTKNAGLRVLQRAINRINVRNKNLEKLASCLKIEVNLHPDETWLHEYKLNTQNWGRNVSVFFPKRRTV